MKKMLIAVFIILFMVSTSYAARISGTLTGYVVEGVTITLSDNSTDSTVTASDGTYIFVDLDNGTYTATPSLSTCEFCTFAPTGTEVAIKTSDNGTGTDFVATANTIDLSPDATCENVSADGRVVKCRYTSTDSISSDNSTQFRLEVPLVSGSVRAVDFNSASTDCGIFLTEKYNQTATSVYSLLSLAEINLNYSPELVRLIYFKNKDTIQNRYLYLTIDNADTSNNTGTWGFNLILGRD